MGFLDTLKDFAGPLGTVVGGLIGGPAGAAIGGSLGSAVSGYNTAENNVDAIEDAAQLEYAATQEALRRSDEAFATSEASLMPYMGTELAANNQLAAQMGITPVGGFQTQIATGGSSLSDSGGLSDYGRSNSEFNLFLRDMLADQVAISMYHGYNEENGKAQMEGARRAEGFLRQLKNEGLIPQDAVMPTIDEMYQLTGQMEQQGFDWGNYGRSDAGISQKATGPESYDYVKRRFQQYGGENLTNTLTEALGQTPGQMTTAADDQRYYGESGGTGPQAMTAEDILAMQGMEGLDPALRDQYMEQVMRSAETDPELAEYLGLTPESRTVGADYQNMPAYMRAMEAGREEVNQANAGAGTLYSGRRGIDVSRMAHDVEADYYDRAQREHESMLNRRGIQRAGEIGLMGSEVAAGRGRQESAYNNYMSRLLQMSAPTTTTNVANMRQNAATGAATLGLNSAGRQGDFLMSSAATRGDAIADITKGLMDVGSGFISGEYNT